MTDSTYHQLKRQTTPAKRNAVPFIKHVLWAKARSVKGYTNGIYCYTEAELVACLNQWELNGRFYQHVTIDDGQDKVEIVIENYDPTMCLTADDCGVWYEVKLRWTESPTLDNLQGIIGNKIN